MQDLLHACSLFCVRYQIVRFLLTEKQHVFIVLIFATVARRCHILDTEVIFLQRNVISTNESYLSMANLDGVMYEMFVD